jgi:hypothetical protein
MSTVRHGLVLAIALSTVAFTTTAMAGQGGFKGATPTAPGHAGDGTNMSPGQDWQSRKGDPAELSPGQRYNQDRVLNSPPGQTFFTPGNRIPGSLP